MRRAEAWRDTRYAFRYLIEMQNLWTEVNMYFNTCRTRVGFRVGIRVRNRHCRGQGWVRDSTLKG